MSRRSTRRSIRDQPSLRQSATRPRELWAIPTKGLFVQDKWRATSNLTLNYGLRWQGETWPSAALNNPLKNFDPRAGFSYAIPGNHSFVIRGGAGLFHGMIPSPLLMCQIPSCGGTIGKFPGREDKQDDLNAKTRLSAFGADPFTMVAALRDCWVRHLGSTATYPLPVAGRGHRPLCERSQAGLWSSGQPWRRVPTLQGCSSRHHRSARARNSPGQFLQRQPAGSQRPTALP